MVDETDVNGQKLDAIIALLSQLVIGQTDVDVVALLSKVGLSNAEIGKSTGMTADAVQMHVSRKVSSDAKKKKKKKKRKKSGK